jgi:DNA gyrase subunit A
VRDESDRDGMRIVIEVKRGEEPQIILNNLFKLTQMQESFGMILLAIVAGQPRELGCSNAEPVHRAPYRSGAPPHAIRSAQGREREHILLGYHIALDYIDDVIKIIADRPAARTPARICTILHQQIKIRVPSAIPSRPSKGVKLDAKKYGIIADDGTPGSATSRSTPFSNCNCTG